MVLAEALLRVPDAATADRLIEDKLATGRLGRAGAEIEHALVSASAWTLGITARIIHPGETPDTILEGLIKRLGLPAVRTATRAGDAAPRLPFRARTDHRRGARARRRRPIPRRCRIRRWCRRHCGRNRG